MGDRDAKASLPVEKETAVNAVLDEAFRNAEGEYGGHTWGVVVVKNGRIVAERYENGWNMHNPSRTNSMCKSISASLVGVAVRDGLYIHSKTPLNAWRSEGDRAPKSLNNLLQMASGLYTRWPQSPDQLYGSGAPSKCRSIRLWTRDQVIVMSMLAPTPLWQLWRYGKP